MRRAGAGDRYFFGAGYFDRILEADGTWLALALSPEGDVAAASIAARSDGFLHYYLSGSADSHLRRLADEERRRRAWSSSPPSSPCRSTSAAASPAATGWRSSSAASPTASSPGGRSELVCDRAAYERLSAAGARRAVSFPRIGAARLARRGWRSALGVLRGRAGEGEGPHRLAAALAPGCFAECRDRRRGFSRPRISCSRSGWSRWSPRPRRAFRRWGRAASRRTSSRRGPSVRAARPREGRGCTGSPCGRARASGRCRSAAASRCRRRRPAGRAVRRGCRRSAGWFCIRALRCQCGMWVLPSSVRLQPQHAAGVFGRLSGGSTS